MLFKPVGTINGRMIERLLIELLTKYEPRAKQLSVNARPISDGTGYNVNLSFTVTSTTTNSSTVTIFLERLA
jgi:predicted component of type VI protein secretion system